MILNNSLILPISLWISMGKTNFVPKHTKIVPNFPKIGLKFHKIVFFIRSRFIMIHLFSEALLWTGIFFIPSALFCVTSSFFIFFVIAFCISYWSTPWHIFHNTLFLFLLWICALSERLLKQNTNSNIFCSELQIHFISNLFIGSLLCIG